MGSNSQSSFASRLGKAKSLQTIVSGYSDYVAPIESASLTTFAQTISDIETLQQQYNTAKSDYTTKTNARKKVFTDNSDSLEKRLSPIRTFIEALKGKNSTELTQITSLVNKIRGNVTKSTSPSTESEAVTISQIERTYASRLSNFKNIIDILTSYGGDYTPPNELITVASLNEVAVNAEASNTAVDLSLSVLKPVIDQRQTMFGTLRQQAQSIKSFIKAQYGLDSNEYKQVKKLTI
ncbi:hypothetical protein [Tenacibaculum amylolyticum]|uniref:hypothetical protein n=1 Tax=Tenacibaculum amylolyticum TaxID=104269 RepID=UPI003896092E